MASLTDIQIGDRTVRCTGSPPNITLMQDDVCQGDDSVILDGRTYKVVGRRCHTFLRLVTLRLEAAEPV